MREKIWSFARRNHPEGVFLSRPLMVLRALLFPLDFVRWWAWQSSGYDPTMDVWIIDGVKYSGEMLRLLSKSSGDLYRFHRQGDVILIQKVEQ